MLTSENSAKIQLESGCPVLERKPSIQLGPMTRTPPCTPICPHQQGLASSALLPPQRSHRGQALLQGCSKAVPEVRPGLQAHSAFHLLGDHRQVPWLPPALNFLHL